MLLPNGLVDELFEEVLVEISTSSWRCSRPALDKRQKEGVESVGIRTG